MAIRVQVILEKEEAARFKSQALKEAKSLSAWLKEAGRQMLEIKGRGRSLIEPGSLKRFFKECDHRESGKEPEWEEHKRFILQGFRKGREP